MSDRDPPAKWRDHSTATHTSWWLERNGQILAEVTRPDGDRWALYSPPIGVDYEPLPADVVTVEQARKAAAARVSKDLRRLASVVAKAEEPKGTI